MNPGGSRRKANALNDLTDTHPLSQDNRKHSYAIDAEDICPGKAHPGVKTTQHQRRNKNRGKTKGRPRGKRSMGRYPFLTELKEYIKYFQPYKSKSTLFEEERKLKMIYNRLKDLKEKGKVSTTNPRKIQQEDMGAFILSLKEQRLKINTIAKYLQYLDNFLGLCGNPVITQMKQKRLLPKKKEHKLDCITHKEAEKILSASQEIPGWQGVVCAVSIPLYYYTLLRPSELRMAHLEDLDTSTWLIYVRYPKGLEKGMETRFSSIPPPARPYVQKYLQARKHRLKEMGIKNCNKLIPCLTQKGRKGQIYATLWNYKNLVEERAEVKFTLQGLRRAGGQHLIDRGVPLEAVSQQHGHASTRTTEKYYARMRSTHAFDLIEEAWSRSPRVSDAKVQFTP